MSSQESTNQQTQPDFTLTWDQIAASAIPRAAAAPMFLPLYLQSVCDRAMDGDPAAIEVILTQATRLTFYCAILASNSKLESTIKPVAERLPAVPILHGTSRGLEEYSKHSYSQFEIGKNSPRLLRGEWKYTNPGSRAVMEVILLMCHYQDSARLKQKAGAPLSPLESLCAELPSTKGPNRERGCRVWRNTFIAFWPEAHRAGALKHELLEEPDLKGYHQRGSNPLAGIKEMVLRFIQGHLET